MPITFTVTLKDKDWRDELRGWDCPALAIPSAEVTALRVEGKQQDPLDYSVVADHQIIQWKGGDPRPRSVLVSIKIVEELASPEKVDEARTEAKKTSDEEWKYRAIIAQVIGSVLVALITAIVTYYATAPKTSGNTNTNGNINTNQNANYPVNKPVNKVRLTFSPTNLTLDGVRTEVAKAENARIEFLANCDDSVKKSEVTTSNARLEGADIKDFFEKQIKPRTSNRNFCVIEVAKDNSYEIDCKPCKE